MAKILIIDDDGIARDALSVFLMREGHRVVSAADGVSGVSMFKSERPDLVILDRNLPAMSGSGVFDEIRKVSRNVPIVVLTGYDDPEEGRIYLKHGAAAFLSKGDGLSRALQTVDGILGPAPAQAAQAAQTSQAAAPAAPLVLVAEDDEQMRDVLARSLRGAGFEVAEAADGLEAEKLVLARKPDIVLLDIFMPGKDGVQVLETLSRELPGTGVIMVSGNEDEEIARDCLLKGAFDYVPKPPNLDSLENIIRNRLFMQRGSH